MQNKKAIAVFSRVPQLRRYSADEPYAALPWEDLDMLFTAMLGDLVEIVCQSGIGDVFVFRDGKLMSDDIFSRFRGKIQIRDLPQGSFAEQVQQVIDAIFAQRYERVLLVLENNPLLPLATVRSVFQQLEYEDDCVIYGPTTDGKCSFLAVKSNYGSLFAADGGDPFGSADVLVRRLCQVNAVLFPTPVAYALDSGFNLSQLRADIENVSREDVYPHRTLEVFKQFDKKYKFKKPSS